MLFSSSSLLLCCCCCCCCDAVIRDRLITTVGGVVLCRDMGIHLFRRNLESNAKLVVKIVTCMLERLQRER